MLKQRLLNLRKLWLSLLLMVGATAIAVPGIQEIAGTEEETVVEIGTVDQLKAFRDAVNSGNQYAGKTVKLTADLDLSSESNWKPIGNLVAYPGQSFDGIFDGQNHTISNLTVNDNTPKHAVAGLFGSVVNGTIKNLTVKNVNITSTHYAAGIVAYTSNGPTIENCHVIGGTIKSTPEFVEGSYDNGDKVGGIMGYATGASTGENPHPASTINNCTVEGVTISGYRDLGGIVGYSDGKVTNNTAKNVTVTQNLTNGYKDTPPTTIGDIVGRGSATNNVEANGNKVIKSDPVAQIGETKYETIAAAVAAANASDVIEIIKAGENTLPNLPKNVTIEGAVDGVVFNHTTTGSVASIPNGATFKNVTFNFGNVDYHGFQHAGTINMEGCTLNGKLFSYGDMNFTDCSFNQSNSDYHMWTYSGNVTYTGCTFTNEKTGKFLNVYNEDGTTKYTVTVNNCKFVNQATSAKKAALNVKATCGSKLLAYDVIINECTTEGAFPAAGDNCVDGGKITGIVVNPLVQVDDRTADGVDNITVTQDGKKIYPVNYVAQIGETKYETLAEAVAAAKSGDTIKLLADLENTGNVSLPAGVTLDGDGKNITGTSAVYINKDGGTVQNVNFKNIHNETSKLSAIYGGNLAGTATITGCTFDNCDWDAIQITPVAGANVVITNNMFSDDVTDNVKQQRYIHVQSKQNVDFSATITENVMPGKLTQEPIGVYYPTDKAKIDLTKNYIESINDVCILVADNNGYAGELVFPAYTTAEKQETYSPVAKIQNGAYAANFYAKLQDAIDAGEGKTVKLLADIDLGNNAASINKTVTIEGGGHTITSTATQAIAISGSEVGNVTINNTIVSAKTRGINVLDVSTDFTLNVNNSTIQSQVDDPTTTYTTGGDSRGINVANADGVKVNITNSTIQGFSYDINIPASGKNLTVNVTGGKTYGRDIVNNWGSNNTFNLNGVKVHGLNNQTGPTEAFSCIVDNAGCQNNNYIIQDCQFIATLSDDAMAAEGSSATEQMMDLRGTNTIVTVKGNTTYTINEGAEARGGIVTNEVFLLEDKGNIVRFDETAKQNFVSWAEKLDAFDFVDKDNENYWPLTFVAQVQLVYPSGDKYYGKYLRTIKSAFEDEKYGDKTQITLLKDITLDENLTCPLTDGQYFILNMSDYAVTKGDYSIALVPGTTVYSTKKTDIFSSANADFKVVETEEDGGFAYTVVAKVYVAQVGEGENAVQYESLEKAIEAISTVTTVNHPKSGMTINQYKANGTVTLLADCDGNGIVIDSGSELTIDFAGHTYSVTGDLVGSDQTEYNGFQLLQNSNVTFKSTAEEPGVINSAKAIFLVQNYSNLTLENMTLDGSNLRGSGAYTLSNNCGNVVIENSTITAKEGAGNFAFDVCRYSSYPSVNVTVKGESVINGNIEVSASKNDPKDGFGLMLEGGTLNGEIVLDGSAKTAMANTPDKAKISKSNSLDITAPAGYMWKDNGDETSTLAKLLARVTHCSGMDYDTNEEMWSSTNCSTAAEVEQNVSLNICDDFASDEWYADRVWVYGELNANLTLGNNQYVYIAELGADAKFTGTISAAEGYILVETDVKEDFDGVYEREHKSAKLYTVRRDPNYAKIKIVKTDGTEYGYDALLSSSELMNIGDGDKMILLDDVDYGYNVPWYPGFDLTIDLNGHTLTNTKGGVLGLSKNKTLTIIDSSESKTGKVALENIANSPVINASSNKDAKLVIESGSVIAPSNSNKGAIVAGSNNEVSITGGCFAGKLSITEGSTATIQISGGVFSQEPAEEYCAEGYIVIANTDPETKDVYPYTVKTGAYVAQIGEGESATKYETLQDAINACEAGTETTIKLLDNVTDGAGFAIPDGTKNKNIVIDFDGKSYNVTKGAVGSSGTLSQAMHFYSGNTLTLKNGTITSAATSEENKLKMMMQNYCDLTLDGMTIDCSNVNGGTYPDYSGTAYEYWSNKSVPVFNFNTGNATIKNTTITFRDGDNMGLCVDGGTVALGEGTVVNGPVSAVTGTVTITGGKYSGAVTSDQATLKISGGIFAEKPADEYCAEGYVVVDNEDEDTKVQYPYTVMSKEDAGIFELIDGEPYERTADIKAKKVTYTRTFPYQVSGNLQCWVVPFDYTITEDDLQNLSFYKTHLISAVESATGGLVQDDSKVYLYYQPVEAGTVLKANKPYFVKVNEKTTENKTFTFEAKNVTLKAKNENCLLNVRTSRFNFDFFATYVSNYKPEAEHWLGVNGNGSLFWNKQTSKLASSYRWYINVTDNENDYAKITFEFIEESDATTNIDNHSFDDKNAVIEGYYTIGGVKLDVPAKGLNIVKFTDGTTKKVYIK